MSQLELGFLLCPFFILFVGIYLELIKSNNRK